MSKILLVDDDIVLAEMVESQLQIAGWKVEKAHNGADAKQMLKSFRYDMILLDWHLPDTTGIEIFVEPIVLAERQRLSFS